MVEIKISARLQLALDIMSQVDFAEEVTQEEMREIVTKIDKMIQESRQKEKLADSKH